MKVQDSGSILTVNNPSQQEFVELWKEYQPFLIDGVAEHWNAYKNWSNDYLLKKCGENTVIAECNPLSFLDNYKYVLQETYERKEIKLKDYMDIITGDKKQNDVECYIAQVDFEKYFSELTQDVDYPNFFNIKPLINFWFGFSGKVSTLHFDGEHNIFVQIRGSKRILLFPPLNYLSFYPPIGENGSYPYFSKVNPINPDLKLFPNFPWQDKIEVVIQAGQMLYIPPFWWHHVTSLNENISLSFWYDIKIQHLFQQKRILSTVLNILPHYIRHSTSSLSSLKPIIYNMFFNHKET